MKAKYMILLAFLLFSQIDALANVNQKVLHTESQYPKVCPLQDGNCLVLSTKTGSSSKSTMSKLDKDGEPLNQNLVLDVSFTGGAELVEPKIENKEERDYHLFYHKNKGSKEMTATFDDSGNTYLNNTIVRKNSLYKRISAVALKNGRVLIAGITSEVGEEHVEITMYDPKTENKIIGITLEPAYSKYISCFEQKENDVYCVFVTFENEFISKLIVNHLKVSENSLVSKEKKVVKTFFTEFNFVKAVPLNDTDFLILFQTGNPANDDIYGKLYGNSGKDLFFYQLETDPDEIVIAKRYEFLYDNCLYREDTEELNADIIALSQKRIYAVCETEEGKFRGFAIYPGVKKIDRFYFNNFDASDVQHPVFAKFGKTLSLFYTHVKDTQNKEVDYFMINYPDCINYRESAISIPQFRSTRLDLDGRIFLSNAYPANRQDEVVKYRIVNGGNMDIINTNTNEKILLNTDLDQRTPLLFSPTDNSVGEYYVQYTATREDNLDGLILGRTCEIKFKTPECLPQCLTCVEKGTDQHNLCLGCKEGFYPVDDNPLPPLTEYGRPHNCSNCNISCTSCYGPFINPPFPQATTNCKRCNYKDGYYPFAEDNRTCISNETQKYWESVFGRAIYIDTNGDANNTEKWVWRYCHEHCSRCEEKGDDNNNKCLDCIDNYHFFCNQTKDHGIAGSCYTGYEGNGFYLTKPTEEYEFREKFCPCLPNCTVCDNATICKECESPLLLAYPNHDACVEECEYCLVAEKGACVNCKDNGRYTLNKTCVNTIPFSDLINRYLHVIDEKCNLLIGCKEGCFNCAQWYSDNCSQCEENYYKEDFLTDYFHCFNKTTCQGVTPYKHNSSLRIGGVAVIEDEVKVCLNCKLRNNSYRQPENDFYCGDFKSRTFIDIDEYNKLSDCYFRCKSCDSWGNSFLMNCTSCRDSHNYDLIQYDGRKGYGNCYRKMHKCGIYPYYHDYDLAVDEDNCGEDCDVCLYNFTCTERFPYFVYETHECVEYCPLTEVLSNNCYMNHSIAGIILLKNPFGLRNPYDFINTTVDINQFISSSLFQYFASSYQIDANSVKKEINNYLGNGQIYNLPESQIIVGNNISIELSSVKLELEKLLGGGGEPKPTDPPSTTPGPSALNISECANLLKKKYGLSDEEDLMVIKGDLLKEYNEFLGTSTEYQLFSTSLGAFLPLSDCEDAGTTVSITNPFSSLSLLTQYQSKTGAVVDNGYNAFDINSPFYHDICTPFTNENGNDVLLDDRRKDYFNENINLCEEGCKFVGYNTSTNMYTCYCNIKSVPGSTPKNITDDGEYVSDEMPKDFKDYISKRSNIEVFKCSSQVFSSSGQKNNFGSYILLTGLASFIGVIVFHFIKERTKMNDIFDSLIENNPSNPPKPVSTKEDKKDKHEKKEKHHHKNDNKDNKDNKDSNVKVKSTEEKKVRVENNGFASKYPLTKPKNIKKDLVLKEDQLNFAPYQTALDKDKRTFIKYYWSLLKMKQLCIFTFYTSEDYILRTTKIVLFILFISFYLAFTALFFNDSIMRAIYIYKGNTNAAIHIPNIILSSLCCLIMSLIVRFVSLNERDISKIIQSPKDERRKLANNLSKIAKIKLFILYAVSGLLICLCWYYVAAFCAVFKNSQGHYLINVLVAFIVCNLWPCVTSFIPAFLRKKALDDGASETLYKVSQIISYF